MKLYKVIIKNFRCFKDVTVELNDTTVLVGENNSGKTSFLEAIKLYLNRTGSRRNEIFDVYDYHLKDKDAEPQSSDELSITLDFIEETALSEELVQELSDLLIVDSESKRHIIFRNKSKYSAETKSFNTELNFLDASMQPLSSKTKKGTTISNFFKYFPFFYLSALRDAAKEFHGKSIFWAPFLKSDSISGDTRKHIQEEIDKLNKEVIESHSPLKEVISNLGKMKNILPTNQHSNIEIEALPGKISELLSKAQINMTSISGAAIPLSKQGAGTQSLAVVFLFESFLKTILSEQYSEFSNPLLALEEPEAHLHPGAIRSLWHALGAITGQKIIATHSGDLLSKVPLTSIRRFYNNNGSIEIRKIEEGLFNPDELENVQYHIQANRGELFFARCWLLGEGESEYWVFKGVSELLGDEYLFERNAIRFLHTSHSGLEPLLKMANSLGISWFFLGDGDGQGSADKNKCDSYLNGNAPDEHYYIMPYKNIEVLLCVKGFGNIYETSVSEQKKASITAAKGTVEYWEQVIRAQPNGTKPFRIRKVITEMKKRGVQSVPSEIKDILDKAKKLGGN